MRSFDRYVVHVFALALILVCVLMVNLLGMAALGRWKVDMTEEKLYTLSPGTRNILGALDDEITARVFYSKTAAGDSANLRAFATYVIGMIREYADRSKGKIAVEVIDPRPDTEEEALADSYGLQAFPGGRYGEPIYLGLVLRDEEGHEQAIPIFTQEREHLMEYEITRAIYSLAHPEKPMVGVISSLDIMGTRTPMNPMAPQQNRPRPWYLVEALRGTFDLVELDTKETDEVPADIQVLLLVHPKDLSEKAKYAIDQYVLRGGRVLAFVDPHCLTDPTAAQARQFQMNRPSSSAINGLLRSWGVELVGAPMDDEEPGPGASGPEVVGDQKLLRAVPTPQGQQQIAVWLSLGRANIDEDSIVTSQLEAMDILTAGALEKITSSDEITVEPLLTSSEKSGMLDAGMVQMMVQAAPEQLLKDLKPDDTKKTLACMISGKFETAFPGGAPEAENEDGEEGDVKSDDETTTPTAEHLDESAAPASIVVAADVDMLADGIAVQAQNFLGQTLHVIPNDNLAFALNAVDVLSGSQDLIGLRSRGQSARPFTKVEEIRQMARERWIEEAEALEAKEQEISTNLRELQQRGGDSPVVLDKDLAEQIKNLREERLATQAKLVEVRRRLREDVEALGAMVKFVNIGLMPLFVALLGLFIFIIRHMRRTRES